MTREEAKEILQGSRITSFRPNGTARVKEALDMAIEALHREEAEEKGYCHRINYIPKPCENANCDCVAVVRCKDCRHAEHREQMPNQVYCKRDKLSTFCAVHDDDDFCKYGERRKP